MRADIERWDRKYRGGNPNPTFQPDALLTTFRHLFDGRGNALDLACGVGQNAIYLARLGYQVVGVDASLVGLRYGQRAAQTERLEIAFVVADLDRFPLPKVYFSLIVVIRFLDRELIPALKAALAPGGLIVYRTFNRRHLVAHPGFPRAFVLDFGELAASFADFELVATNDGRVVEEPLTFFIGRRAC